MEPVPPRVARSGGPLTRWLGRVILTLTGWKVEGSLPDRGRIVAVVAPHSSYWDFIVAIGLVFSWNLRIRFVGKKELFRFPLKGLLLSLGGIPVDRQASRGFVDQVVAEIERSGQILLGMAPEGTRTFGARWKTGFHRIASQANASILPVALDWRQRVIRLLPEVVPSGDARADLGRIVRLFATCPRKDGRTIDPALALADSPPP